MGQIDLAVLDLDHQSLFLQVGHDVLARGHDELALVRTGRLGQRAVEVQDIDHRQIATQADFVVVRVVGRRDFDTSSPHLGLGPLVGDQRNLSPEKRQFEHPPVARHITKPDQVGEHLRLPTLHLVELSLNLRFQLLRRRGQTLLQIGNRLLQCRRGERMHRDRRIAEHRLGPRRRNGHMGRLVRLRVDHRIVEIPEMAADRLVEDFVVGDGRLQRRVPVDQPFAPIDQPGLEQAIERMADGPGTDRV